MNPVPSVSIGTGNKKFFNKQRAKEDRNRNCHKKIWLKEVVLSIPHLKESE